MTGDTGSTGEMRFAVVLREAYRDVQSAGARSLLAFGIASVVMITIGVGETHATAKVLADEAGFIAAGGFTVVASNDAQAVDTRTCLDAGRSPGVRHVAALGRADNVTVATASHTRFSKLAINRDAFPVIAPTFPVPGPSDTRGRGWILGGSAAAELGIAVGDNLAVGSDVRPVAAVIPEEQFRLSSLARSVMTLEPLDDQVERCVLDLDRVNFRAQHNAVSAMFAHAGEETTVGVFHRRDALVQPPRQALAQRATRWTSVGGALVLGVVAALSMWARRTDLAVRRSVGTTAWSTMAITTVEHGLLLWPATVLAASVSAAVGSLTQPWLPADQLLIAMRSILIAGLGSFVVVAPAALVIAAQSNAATLKDR